jgi:hypothetical protein
MLREMYEKYFIVLPEISINHMYYPSQLIQDQASFFFSQYSRYSKAYINYVAGYFFSIEKLLFNKKKCHISGRCLLLLIKLTC